MGTTTLLQDLINPEVMADMVSYELENGLQATRFFKVDRTLTGRAGDTITVPSFLYIGEAQELPENERGDISELHTEDISYTVKKAVKNVQLTDEAVLSAHGDVMGETTRQLALSIRDKMENDAIKLLKAIEPAEGKLTHDASGQPLSYDVLVEAIDLLRIEAQNEPLILLVGRAGIKSLRTSDRFLDNHILGGALIVSGAVGTIAGCQVVISNRLDEVGATSKAFVFKPEVFTAFMKRDIAIESEREMLYKRTLIGSDCHYVIAIEDFSKVVSITHAKNS